MDRLLWFAKLCFIVNIFLISNVNCYDFTMENIEFINYTASDGIYKVNTWRIKKISRTEAVMVADVDFFKDIDDSCQMEVEIFYSYYGNLQYVKTIAGIEKMNFCQMMAKYYKKYFMPDFKEYSNLPQFEEDEKPCPFKKGKYWIKNYKFNPENLPKQVSDGRYRIDLNMYGAHGFIKIATVRLFVKIENSELD